MLNRLWNRNIFKKKAQANHFVLVYLNWEVARPRATSAKRHFFWLSLSYTVSIAHINCSCGSVPSHSTCCGGKSFDPYSFRKIYSRSGSMMKMTSFIFTGKYDKKKMVNTWNSHKPAANNKGTGMMNTVVINIINDLSYEYHTAQWQEWKINSKQDGPHPWHCRACQPHHHRGDG